MLFSGRVLIDYYFCPVIQDSRCSPPLHTVVRNCYHPPNNKKYFISWDRYGSPNHRINVHWSSLLCLVIDACESNVFFSSESSRNMWGTHEIRKLELKRFFKVNWKGSIEVWIWWFIELRTTSEILYIRFYFIF